MMYFWLILGLATLIVGGEFLVRSAVSMAKRFHISTLVIGMTVISFGTSAPELIVSINAALTGHPEIAIGNVIGSNIANIALVLGITVLIFPLVVDRNSKIIDWPMMMLATLLFFFFSLDGIIVFYEGFVLFAILITFTYLLIRNSRKTTKKAKLEAIEEAPSDEAEDSFPKSILLLIIGLTGLFFGAKWLLFGAVGIALELGMEERVIAVTIVAFGTSVPELITSAIAAIKKETGISIGNLIGSNIFNIMAVIGITSMIHPIAVGEESINFDMWWMIAIAAAILPMMIIGKKIGRLKGAILLSTYVIYISILVLGL
ncbi:calcium/sodium antiporter [Crocinitomix catalasitica]|uniref:calcium/sodium antiporter n=1 Tax=Crocinitomix catalasitica TaxID=184607 RepID=UPI00047FA49E|nr:calcium/sodium antiporter [Crocinitomix catalasitica]